MKIYSVTSTSSYRYSSPASHGYHLARLVPAAGNGQSLLTAHVEVAPTPAHTSRERDFFGNSVLAFSLDKPHSTLVFTMRAKVSVARQASLLAPTMTLEQTVAAAQGSGSLDAASPAHFLRPTARTLAEAPLRIFAARFFQPGVIVTQACEDLSRAIRADLTYDTKATTVDTDANAAFRAGGGVCQDFAHIMIAACRCVGVPARYVTGYIRTDPPPGKPRLEGADAMHAWVSVWTGPATGWIDHDPTNGCLVGEDHITVAVGRDYEDTAPIRGEVVGSGEQSHTVAVDVVETT